MSDQKQGILCPNCGERLPNINAVNQTVQTKFMTIRHQVIDDALTYFPAGDERRAEYFERELVAPGS